MFGKEMPNLGQAIFTMKAPNKDKSRTMYDIDPKEKEPQRESPVMVNRAMYNANLPSYMQT